MVSDQRHVAVLRSELQQDEAERLWVRAERLPQGHAGVLMVSDRRVLFSGLGFVQQSQEAWPLAVVRVEPSDGDVLALRVLGMPERFRVRERDRPRVVTLIDSEDGGEARDSLVAELERLATLREQGVLTAAEFEGAKRRLLE